MVTTIETRETTASDSSSDHRDYWCSRDAPQPLVSNDSPPGKATSGSPQVHYRAPWPITSPVVKKVSLQSSPPATGNVREDQIAWSSSVHSSATHLFMFVIVICSGHREAPSSRNMNTKWHRLPCLPSRLTHSVRRDTPPCDPAPSTHLEKFNWPKQKTFRPSSCRNTSPRVNTSMPLHHQTFVLQIHPRTMLMDILTQPPIPFLSCALSPRPLSIVRTSSHVCMMVRFVQSI